jgi:2-oxoglutarate-Fe(II)-dependent dioxygenase family protein
VIDLRLRTRVSDAELSEKWGKIVTDDDYNVILHRDATVRKPDGTVLAIYRRGVIPPDLAEQAWPILHELRVIDTANRGAAGGSKRFSLASGRRTEAKRVASAIVGAFDRKGPRQYCRLTAWTGQEPGKWRELWPLLEFIGERMKVDASERYRVQMEFVERTQPEWVIAGTPFTTVTVNNTYPTGVHTDKGDLDEGISTLAVLRRGNFTGGRLVFPEYRVAVDMQNRDLLLMDAHSWHGNTALVCGECGERMERDHPECGAERISVVSYFRTRMVECGTGEDEEARARQYADQRNAALVGD